MRRGPLVLIALGLGAMLIGGTGVFLALRSAPLMVSLATTSPVASSKASTASSSAPSLSALPNNSAARTAGASSTTADVPIARISIPRIGVRSAPVYERGVSTKGIMLIASGYAVTHYAFSAPLGAGNAVLYGHDDIQGNIFGHLYDLASGDLIEISLGGVTQTYRVSGHQIVAPTAVSILAPTNDARLTIITCWPFNVDTKRWIVTAVRV